MLLIDLGIRAVGLMPPGSTPAAKRRALPVLIACALSLSLAGHAFGQGAPAPAKPASDSDLIAIPLPPAPGPSGTAEKATRLQFLSRSESDYYGSNSNLPFGVGPVQNYTPVTRDQANDPYVTAYGVKETSAGGGLVPYGGASGFGTFSRSYGQAYGGFGISRRFGRVTEAPTASPTLAPRNSHLRGGVTPIDAQDDPNHSGDQPSHISLLDQAAANRALNKAPGSGSAEPVGAHKAGDKAETKTAPLPKAPPPPGQ